LYWTYFLHIWQLHSCSTLENAVVFSTADEPVIIVPIAKISPKTADVKQGATQQFTGTVEDGTATSQTYEVTGKTKAGTTISSTGLLTVDVTEPVGTKLTVTYKAVVGAENLSDTAEVTVTSA